MHVINQKFFNHGVNDNKYYSCNTTFTNILLGKNILIEKYCRLTFIWPNIILYNIDINTQTEKLSNNSLIQAQCIYVLGKYDCSSVLHPIHTSYRFLITRRRAPPTRKRGEKARIVRCRLVGVVTRTFRPLANLRPRRCFPVSASPPDRPSPLFDEKIREERPTPRVWHIGFPSTVLLSRSLFFSRDEVIDIFHEKNRRIYVYVNTLAAIGLSKGENFRSSYWFFVFFLLVLYFRFEGIDDWWSLKRDDVCVMSWFWKLLALYREKVCQNFII